MHSFLFNSKLNLLVSVDSDVLVGSIHGRRVLVRSVVQGLPDAWIACLKKNSVLTNVLVKF